MKNTISQLSNVVTPWRFPNDVLLPQVFLELDKSSSYAEKGQMPFFPTQMQVYSGTLYRALAICSHDSVFYNIGSIYLNSN